MTQKEKNILLYQLCASLPHGIICQITDMNDSDFKRDGELREIKNVDSDCNGTKFLFWNEHVPCYSDITEIRPYLRPRSSMTAAEVGEYISLKEYIVGSDDITYFFETHESIDWLNAHHFDYRGLIGKGLALEAPEEMYN